MKEPTKAQAEILEYLWNSGAIEHTISGGDLVEHYHTRWVAKIVTGYEERDAPVPAWVVSGMFSAGDGRSHAWRRTGGLQLRRMAEAEIVHDVGFIHGVPQYEVSADGHDWIEKKMQ